MRRTRRLAVCQKWSADAVSSRREAERHLAAERGDAWAEKLDLGVSWSGGAPLPYLISNGTESMLICHAAVDDPAWDGTSVRIICPNDPTPAALLEFTFSGCQAVAMGGPNDEALHGHPLYSNGLDGYGCYIVHNSEWLSAQELISSVHAQHQGGWHEHLTHYFFVFHDEIFEVLARSVDVRTVQASLTDGLLNAARKLM